MSKKIRKRDKTEPMKRLKTAARMAAEERRTLSILNTEIYGVANPCRAEFLSENVGVDGRQLRRIINKLRFADGVKIGSVPGVNGGYYIISDEEGLKKHESHFHARALTALMNVAAGEGISLEDAMAAMISKYDDMSEADVKKLLPGNIAENFKKSGKRGGVTARVMKSKQAETQLAKFKAKLKELNSIMGEDAA